MAPWPCLSPTFSVTHTTLICHSQKWEVCVCNCATLKTGTELQLLHHFHPLPCCRTNTRQARAASMTFFFREEPVFKGEDVVVLIKIPQASEQQSFDGIQLLFWASTLKVFFIIFILFFGSYLGVNSSNTPWWNNSVKSTPCLLGLAVKGDLLPVSQLWERLGSLSSSVSQPVLHPSFAPPSRLSLSFCSLVSLLILFHTEEGLKKEKVGKNKALPRHSELAKEGRRRR